MPNSSRPAPLRGLAAGVLAGLVASLTMNRFQALWSKIAPLPGQDGDPSTVKAAQGVSRAATGQLLPKEDKEAAGTAVHYVFGAAMGGGYGLLAEYAPAVTAGFGGSLGAVTFAADEIGVPAAGLSGPPTKYPPVVHAYDLASHVVFGATAEAARRLARKTILA